MISYYLFVYQLYNKKLLSKYATTSLLKRQIFNLIYKQKTVMFRCKLGTLVKNNRKYSL